LLNIDLFFDISYHSYSELVIYPYGCKGDRAETYDVVEKIGKEIARLIDYEPGTAWELLYNADGGDIDWMYAAYQVIPYVIELNSRWQGFHPKYNRWRDKTVQRNRDGWQYLIQRAHESGIRGQVRLNGQELSEYNLNVYKVTKGERVKYQEYIGHRNGVFHLVLNPGTYELEFEDNGAILGSETIDVDSSLLWKSFNF
jgi:carboxypeptidase T